MYKRTILIKNAPASFLQTKEQKSLRLVSSYRHTETHLWRPDSCYSAWDCKFNRLAIGM